jgi:phosphatidyl-myo-inositol dimannoside synthase
MERRKILLLVLAAFSTMGGIEKFNRALMKAFSNLAPELNLDFSAAGMNDTICDENYINHKNFRSYHGSKINFVFKTILSSLFKDELVLGHINLAFIGVVFKFLRPFKKLTVICHGIEVFDEVSGMKKKVLQKADRLLAVSEFTRQKLILRQSVPAAKITVFHNTLDPYFQMPSVFIKPSYLQKRYGIRENEKIIFTLTRLSVSEGYKGYDKVIQVLKDIKSAQSVKYLIAGKADKTEKANIESLIGKLGLKDQVILCGYIPEEEITDHYLLADVFIMPSKGEGFGIVYLEAMACGLPVIAGNKDGSVDALANGALGTLVDPDSSESIKNAIEMVLNCPTKKKPDIDVLLSKFSFKSYVQNLYSIIKN